VRDMVLPLRHSRAWALFSIVLVAVVVVGSLVPGADSPKIPLGDKWQHALTYGGLALWFSGIVRRSAFLWVAGGLLALGGLMELLQAVATTARSADIRDMLANTIGIAAGLAIACAGAAGWAVKVEKWLNAR
jgi:VanZ family protein